jgi:hypothetical protein
MRQQWDLPEATTLRSLLHERNIAITGMVLGEVLQGVRSTDPRAELEDLLLNLPFLDDGALQPALLSGAS